MTRGSPPHTRGQLRSDRSSEFSERITPAYAGTTGSDHQRCDREKDHPRIRGDNDIMSEWGYRRKGSPPHTRGQHT